MDLNREEFFWNNDFGKNEFLYEPHLTDYNVLGLDGQVLKHVKNGQGMNYLTPALVPLPAGSYTVEAGAEEFGGQTLTVVVPLVVEPGQTTTVHQEPDWKPSGEMMDPARMVRLADGRIVGCRAGHLLSQTLSHETSLTQSNTP